MPILRIVADQKLSSDEVNQVKVLGSILGYNDPRCIWVETSDGLSQDDVMYVMVMCEQQDFENSEFEPFCVAVASYLKHATDKSVEIVRPINGGVSSIFWSPTKEGERIYGDAN